MHQLIDILITMQFEIPIIIFDIKFETLRTRTRQLSDTHLCKQNMFTQIRCTFHVEALFPFEYVASQRMELR